MPDKIIPPYKEEEKQLDKPDYSDDEIEYYKFLTERLDQAKDMREDTHIEFDDNDYITHYDTNYKTGNAYIRPKLNKEDTRIVTGTTLEKENTLLATVLNYNFAPNIDVFDSENLPLMGIGDKIESLVKKSREIEEYENKRPLYYKEGADQGTWFVEDTWVEEWEIQKEMKKYDYSKIDVKNLEWTEKRKRKIIGCQSNLIPGTGVYLGNIKEFFIERQPYICTRDVITYAEAEACYGEYDRFKHVSKDLSVSENDENSEVRDWTLENLKQGFVEVVKYQDKWANEYMLIFNGVMMLKAGFPLTEISPSGEYTIAKGDFEPISKFFAYSKSYPAKTKVDQEIFDQTLRTMVLRLRQMQEPPLVNNTSRVLSRRIFYPGRITPDVNPNQIQPLIPNNTIGAGEFNVFQLIKQIIDEKTSNPVMSGDSPQGDQTATEIMQTKQQSMLKMGYAIYGILAFEKRLTWLRIYNILSHWTQPIDSRVDELKGQIKDMYRRISVDESDEYGDFTRIIEFDTEGLGKEQEQLDAEANILSNEGKQVQKVYLNPKVLRSNLLKWTFFVNITPTPKNTSELESVLFEEKILKAKQIFGPMSTNDEYLKSRFAVIAKEDPEKFWAKQPQGMPGMEQMAGAQGGQTPVSNDMMKTMPKPQKPSINSMVKQ